MRRLLRWAGVALGSLVALAIVAYAVAYLLSESPGLQVVAAYSPEAFAELIRPGAPLGGRKLATMGPWARQNLSQFTDTEITALYSYLHTLPGPTRN